MFSPTSSAPSFWTARFIFGVGNNYILIFFSFSSYAQMAKFLWSCRVGFIFTLGTDGLQTFGRERQMVKAVSIRSPVMSFLVISKMGGDMASSFVLMLMEQGLCPVPFAALLISDTIQNLVSMLNKISICETVLTFLAYSPCYPICYIC